MRPWHLLLAAALFPSPALAQGWRVRTDTGPDSAVAWQQMPPGWHITTGPGSVLYDPANQARGRFAIEAEIFLFPGDSNEGYGLLLGGADLDSPGRSWTAFLITRDGSATIERRRNNITESITPPTKADAVKPHPGGEGTAHNVIRVLVQGDSAIFSANGQRITAVPSRDLALDGVFGFRVGKGVNLHVSNLDFINRLAPFPARR